MKKRLRAEIWGSFIKMGQAGMNVDADLYQRVCERLNDRALCGSHATQAAPLPPRPQRLSGVRAAQVRAARFVIDDASIDAIVGEELPSKTNWHRYLVRWAGYDPSWEAWRLPGRGAAGDPVESWEPAEKLRGAAALSGAAAMEREQDVNDVCAMGDFGADRACSRCGEKLHQAVIHSITHAIKCDGDLHPGKRAFAAGQACFTCFACGLDFCAPCASTLVGSHGG